MQLTAYQCSKVVHVDRHAFVNLHKSIQKVVEIGKCLSTIYLGTVEPDFSKLFEKHKNVYYYQMFTIYHVIYAMIANFGKQQKVWLKHEVYVYYLSVYYLQVRLYIPLEISMNF